MTIPTTLTEDAKKLIARCGRGGQYQYYWTDMGDLTRWFEVGKPSKLGKRDLKGNMYFGVHPTSTNRKGYHKVRARIGDIAAVNCLFADFDGKDFDNDKSKILAYLDTLEIYPSVVVDSGGGFHCYWFLPEPVPVTDDNREHVRAVQLCWVDLLGADQGAKGLNHPLRIPGTLNHKDDYAPDFPTVTVVRADWERTVPFCRFEELTAKLRNKRQQRTEYTQPTTPIDVDDQTLLEEAFSNPTNGVSIRALWNGDISAYASQSSADLALCCHLAYYTGRDKARMDALFRQSGLYREKWERNDYRDSTLDGANEMTTNVWTPPRVYTNGAGPGRHDDDEADWEPLIDPIQIAEIIFKFGKRPRYMVQDGVICERKEVEDKESGETDVFYMPLCNFAARIVADVLRDDGEEITRHLAISGALQNGEPLSEILIPASDFENMKWVISEWGGRAAIEPARPQRDKTRHAVQYLSGATLERRHVYTHTGWRIIDGQRVFLHGGGALGMDGITVELPRDLTRYELPHDEGDPVQAMRQSIKLLDIAPDAITYLIWAAMYLAPLSSIITPAFMPWIEGESGAMKTTLTALMLNHFGAKWNDVAVPADWMGTANSLEKLTFVAKDVPLLIDDFRPAHSRQENAQMMTAAQRIIRAVGNRSARSRLDGDSELRRSFSPRGVTLATAERGALGNSTNARVMTVAIERGDIDTDKLSEAQRQREIYGYAMRGFLTHVAANWDSLAAELPRHLLDKRTEVGGKGEHLRLPNALATLYTAFETAMNYAFAIGAIDATGKIQRLAACEAALVTITEEQSRLVADQDPAGIFMSTLVTLLRAGKTSIVNKSLSSDIVAAGYGDPNGERIGWHTFDTIFLLPTAYNAVCRYVSAEGGMFPSDEATLRKQLSRRGYIERQGDRLTMTQRDESGAAVRVMRMLKDKFDDLAQRMGIDAADMQYTYTRSSWEQQ